MIGWNLSGSPVLSSGDLNRSAFTIPFGASLSSSMISHSFSFRIAVVPLMVFSHAFGELFGIVEMSSFVRRLVLSSVFRLLGWDPSSPRSNKNCNVLDS